MSADAANSQCGSGEAPASGRGPRRWGAAARSVSSGRVAVRFRVGRSVADGAQMIYGKPDGPEIGIPNGRVVFSRT